MMTNWAASDLEIGGARLRVYRAGRPGGRPVLFAHGLTDNARYWARTVEALGDDYDVALYDARGHGGSGPAPVPFPDEQRAEDLIGVAEALGLERPILIGHSMGATTAALAAARQTQLARAVVLEDPPWLDGYVPPEAARAYLADWKARLVRMQTVPRDEALELRRQDAAGWAESDLELSLEARRQCDPSVIDGYQAASGNWREVVSAIECPILLLTGENALGAVATPQLAREAQQLWRTGRWVAVAGASHAVRFSRFDRYLDALRSFLAELSP